MRGTFFINGEEVGIINEMPKIIGIDYAKGKDNTGIAYKGTMTMETGPGWGKFKLFLDIRMEKHLKNVAAFRKAWADKRKGRV